MTNATASGGHASFLVKSVINNNSLNMIHVAENVMFPSHLSVNVLFVLQGSTAGRAVLVLIGAQW